MPDILKTQWRKARKRHVCSFCNQYIEPGERYKYDTLVYEGSVYDWFSHEKCDFLANELWSYVDPDDSGMTADDFQETCQDFCFHFVCPDCEHWDRENRECTADDCCCIDKAYETLKKYELYMTKERGLLCWKLRPRKDAEVNGET